MKKIHITLINPPFIFADKKDINLSQCLGLLYIAAYLKEKKGHCVTVIDSLFEGYNKTIQLRDGLIQVGLRYEEVVNMIPEHTDLIGLSVPFSHFDFVAHALISRIKTSFPTVPLVMGGVYPSTQPAQAIQSGTDYIVLGEGELALSELINYIYAHESTPIPNGIISKKIPAPHGKVISSYVQDVDSLPLPARNLLQFKQYIKISARGRSGWRSASIITSRGCPFDCEFCSVHPVSGYKWRPHSPERVLMEIDELSNKFQVNNIEIEDDNFTLKRERAIEILDGIKERNNKNNSNTIYWSALNGLRIDTLDEELIRVIASSNCIGINIALEHGDQEMLKIMKKKLDLSRVIEVVRLLYKYNISTTVFVIYGFPGESRKRFENGLNFYIHLKKIAPTLNFAFFPAQPYPGTNLFDLCVQEGYIKHDIFENTETNKMFSPRSTYQIKTPDFDEVELKWRRSMLINKVDPSIYWRAKFIKIIPGRLHPHAKSFYNRAKRVFKI